MSSITLKEDEADSSINGRLHFWAVAIDMAQSNPWFGVGYGAYNLSYDAYDFSSGAFGTSRSVHSAYFGVLAELGYLGAILYLLVFLSAFHSCSRVRKLARGNPALSELGLSAMALQTGIIVFLVGGAFVPKAYNEMIWHYIGLSIILERLAMQHLVSTQRRELFHVSVEPAISVAGEASW
jgi:O-antigen ligase